MKKITYDSKDYYQVAKKEREEEKEKNSIKL